MTRTFDAAECEAIVRRMWPHLDGVLSSTERERVTRHLEECGNCRSHFDFARSFLEAVHKTRAADNDADVTRLRQRVMAALAAEGFESEG